MVETEDRLRRLALHDEEIVRSVLSCDLSNRDASALDAKTYALVRLAALLALDGAPASYQWAVGEVFASGASVDEAVGTLTATAPVIGVARTVKAAPKLALAVGHDIDASIEEFD